LASEKEADFKALREGIELIYRQFKEIMTKLGVEEIKALARNSTQTYIMRLCT